MKKFFDYITESEKEYEFKVRIAGEAGEGVTDKLETILKKYDLISVALPAKTPIQEMPLHFPQVHNVEVYTYDTKVRYPVTAHVLKKYISDSLTVPESHITVTSPTEPFEKQAVSVEDGTYETLLTKTEMEQAEPDAQKAVGGERIMDLLKELESARKDRKEGNPLEGTPKGSSTDISSETNTKPVIGG